MQLLFAVSDLITSLSCVRMVFLYEQEGRKPTDSAQQDGYDKVWTCLRTLSVNKVCFIAY